MESTPGALPRFLQTMNPRWKISLFHSCNHGSGEGRVFFGLQAPAGEEEPLAAFLEDLGHPWAEETLNEAATRSPPPGGGA